MAVNVLSPEEATKQLGVKLISNAKGTQAVHETVVAYRANRRAGTACTKNKGAVSGSNKKPWRQKGTGNARAGCKASPIWRGGGVVFGPHPRDYSKKTPKKVKRLALQKALSSRILNGDISIIEVPSLKEAKTKGLVQHLEGVFDQKKPKSTLIVLEVANPNVILAARNHPHLETITAQQVNAEDLMIYKNVAITEAGLKVLGGRLNS